MVRVRILGPVGTKTTYALDRLGSAARIEVVTSGEADIIAGVMSNPEIADIALQAGLRLPEREEAFELNHVGPAALLIGADEQGLMYGLLEVADQLDLEGVRVSELRATSESPHTAFRGVFTFLHNADCDAEWFHSEAHWTAYFDLMARSRFNSFQIVMAHQTNYLAPPFPYFVSVEDHPEVFVSGLSASDQARNAESLKMVSEMAAARGLAFVLGIWQVKAWSPASRGGHVQRSLVEGLSDDMLTDYTYQATRKMLLQFPAISGIQIRVNGESGIPQDEQTDFFANSIVRAIREADREVLLDLRGWIALPETVDAVIDADIPMRLSMKHWAEHLGAPYPAPKQEPAYSYADFLARDRPYDISYQVWTLGSHRHFVWGDPRFVRTFARGLALGDSIGFEISPPLAQKGYGNEPGTWRILESEHEYYQWEWQRYWLFYLLFGRLTYNPNAREETWLRHLRCRFGEAAEHVLEGYTWASRVVSFLIRYNMSDPNMYIWPEADTGGLLDFYASVPPSDPAMIASFDESVAERITGHRTAKMSPPAASAYLRDIGQQCHDLAMVLDTVPATHDVAGLELASTATDIAALGELALYHSHKILAAYALATYYETGDLAEAVSARNYLRQATPHWERLAEITHGVYTDHQVTGPIDSGHWKDKLLLVREDELRIEERIALHGDYGAGTIGGAVAAFDFGEAAPAGYSYTRFAVHHDMVERGFVGVGADVEWKHPTQTRWGWEDPEVVEAIASPLARFCDRHLDSVFRDTMNDPGYSNLVPFTNTLFRDFVFGSQRATFNCVVEAGEYEVIALFSNRSVDPRSFGPFDVSLNGQPMGSIGNIAYGTHSELRARRTFGRGLMAMTFTPDPGCVWFCSALIVRPLAPSLAHAPIDTFDQASDLVLKLSATGPDPIDKVAIIVDGAEPLPMDLGEEGLFYEIVVPAESVPAGTTIDYSFIATSAGRTTFLPAPTGSATPPAFRARSIDSRVPGPVVNHEPVERSRARSPIIVEATVEHTHATERVVLHFRYANQYYEWKCIPMTEVGGNRHLAEIPREYVNPVWDVMYYIEVVDIEGRGTMAPGMGDMDTIPYWVVRIDD